MTAAQRPSDRPMTVAEFLAHDDGSSTRYELVDGVMVAMNPPHPRHADIVENVGRTLDPQVPPSCRVYRTEVGMAASDEGRHWREPGVVVTCVRPEAGYIRSPRLVVEVLSPSTEKDDRTTKLDFYETLPSLEAILLSWQDSRRVRLRTRRGDDWIDHNVIDSGTVQIESLGVELTLDEIDADPWTAEAG